MYQYGFILLKSKKMLHYKISEMESIAFNHAKQVSITRSAPEMDNWRSVADPVNRFVHS